MNPPTSTYPVGGYIPSKGNWRVIFRFVGSDIELVDYLDYH